MMHKKVVETFRAGFLDFDQIPSISFCRTKFTYSSKNMEELESLNFNEQIQQSANQSRLAEQNLDQVTLHCRRDHLSPTVQGGKSSSCYHSSYTPVKNGVNYNQTEIEKGLSRFRKYENSTSLLPTIPKISEHSHYQKSYHGHSQEKPVKAQEKQSFFLKLNWALDPTSNYRKDFMNRDGQNFNKNNAERVNHNQLNILKIKDRERNSNYRNDFKAYNIKKEAQISIGVKDHLNPSSKQNLETNISEYQRKYDSVMELTKGKQPILSIYKKNVISRQR